MVRKIVGLIAVSISCFMMQGCIVIGGIVAYHAVKNSGKTGTAQAQTATKNQRTLVKTQKTNTSKERQT